MANNQPKPQPVTKPVKTPIETKPVKDVPIKK
jgi:hypothetical protein